MAKSTKRALKWGIVVLAVAAAAFIGFRYVQSRRAALPKGIVSGNGRLDAQLVDVAPKEALRVEEILVNEGDLVKPKQVLARCDTSTLEAQLAEANASVAAEQESLAGARAAIAKQKSEIELAKIEVAREERLVRDHAGSQRELDVRRTKLKTTTAGLAEAQAALQTAEQKVKVAQEKAAAIVTRINDATLTSPVIGRVLYRLAEVGEVLPPGGKALTVVNLQDVYMEIFLPAEEAAKATVGSPARITLDYAPGRAIAGYVSFVSPEAQFTPKQVETRSEREKLMFRVKLQVPQEVAEQYLTRIITGVRGVGYVRLDPSAAWPSRLQHLVGRQPPGTAQAE